jgi:hypothetical protein
VTQQIINVGSAINDGTGDPARVAFTHCNENFTELYTLVRPTGQTIEYQFNNTTTEPPSTGQIRFNQATQASTTKIWASHTTSSGINIKQFLSAATTGAKLILQDKIDNTNYIKFDVTGAPVDKTTYWEFTVAVTASGGTLPNAAVLAAVTAAASSVGAAPFDAQAYNGLQINGSMEVSQENGTAGISISNTAKYSADGWLISSSGSQVIGVSQNTTAPVGYINSQQVAVSTANASPAAANYVFLAHRIEGYRIARLAWGTASASPITIGFWIYAVRPGIYSAAILNGASTRSYPFTFTINAASTWEYKTVTIPGDTTGAWVKDNTSGMQFIITMMAGTNFQAAANVWTTGVFFAVAGSVNGVAATSDFILVTGIIILPGIEAPSAARSPFIMRPYDQELALCKRYYRKIGGQTAGDISISGYTAFSNGNMSITISLDPAMRAIPTVATFGSWSYVNITNSYYYPSTNSLGWTIVSTTAGGFGMNTTVGAGFTVDARL